MKAITKKGQKFVNTQAAMMAFQAAQIYFATQGFLTTSMINIHNKKMALTIYFDLETPPTIPFGYTYSEKEITSQTYYSEHYKAEERVRTMELTYKW